MFIARTHFTPSIVHCRRGYTHLHCDFVGEKKTILSFTNSEPDTQARGMQLFIVFFFFLFVLHSYDMLKLSVQVLCNL